MMHLERLLGRLLRLLGRLLRSSGRLLQSLGWPLLERWSAKQVQWLGYLALLWASPLVHRQLATSLQ